MASVRGLSCRPRRRTAYPSRPLAPVSARCPGQRGGAIRRRHERARRQLRSLRRRFGCAGARGASRGWRAGVGRRHPGDPARTAGGRVRWAPGRAALHRADPRMAGPGTGPARRRSVAGRARAAGRRVASHPPGPARSGDHRPRHPVEVRRPGRRLPADSVRGRGRRHRRSDLARDQRCQRHRCLVQRLLPRHGSPGTLHMVRLSHLAATPGGAHPSEPQRRREPDPAEGAWQELRRRRLLCRLGPSRGAFGTVPRRDRGSPCVRGTVPREGRVPQSCGEPFDLAECHG